MRLGRAPCWVGFCTYDHGVADKWLIPKSYKSGPGFDPAVSKLPRLGIDTNVVMDALFGGESGARELLKAGRDGKVELAVSKAFDDEFKPRVGVSGIDPTKDELWPTIEALPRLSRPGAVIGYARIGEMRIGDDGAFGVIHGKQSGKEHDRSIRDEEHVSSAFDEAWGAVAFVTREKRLLESDELRRRGWRIVTPEEVLEQLAL